MMGTIKCPNCGKPLDMEHLACFDCSLVLAQAQLQVNGIGIILERIFLEG